MSAVKKLSASCRADPQFCERIEKLIYGFLSGETSLVSCKGRSAYRFRAVAEGGGSAGVWGPPGEGWVMVEISLSTGAVVVLYLDKERLCVLGADVGFVLNPGVSISYRLVARS
jgi:hypothetical protein